jgi:hypothetical protein
MIFNSKTRKYLRLNSQLGIPLLKCEVNISHAASVSGILRTIAFFLTIILIGFSSCKKSNTVQKTIINTSISNGFPQGGANYLNGVLYARKQILIPEGDVTYSSAAGFSSSTLPMTNYYYLFDLLTTILGNESAGIVKVNSSVMKWRGLKTSSMQIYQDSTRNPEYSGGISWDVGGNVNFSSFNTSVSRGFPVITDASFLPDTISKSQPLYIHSGKNNYSNTDSIMIGFKDDTNIVYKYFGGTDSVFVFTPEEMSILTAGSVNREIKVFAKNFSNMIVNNKRYVFIMHTDLIKFITVIP